ncbi:MAG: response regulator [Elainellaceae cyanobacterium]
MVNSSVNKDKVNVLLVEDDEVDIINVKRALQKSGINLPLYIANHGQEALEMLRGHGGKPPVVPPDRRLILLDLNMPTMDGLQFLKELREDPHLRGTPVVILTTSDAEQDRQHAFDFNVAGYMLKSSPFTEFARMMTLVHQYWTASELP